MKTMETEFHIPKIIYGKGNLSDYREAVCSACGELLDSWFIDEDKFGIVSKYCPNCGARIMPNDTQFIVVDKEELRLPDKIGLPRKIPLTLSDGTNSWSAWQVVHRSADGRVLERIYDTEMQADEALKKLKGENHW